MFEDLKTIVIGGKEFPYKCDICVLEKIQEEFGNLTVFERKLLGIEEGEDKATSLPDVKAVSCALYWMIREGVEIQAEENGKTAEMPSRKALLRMVDQPFYTLTTTLYEEFSRCFISKNQKTAQEKQEENQNP